MKTNCFIRLTPMVNLIKRFLSSLIERPCNKLGSLSPASISTLVSNLSVGQGAYRKGEHLEALDQDRLQPYKQHVTLSVTFKPSILSVVMLNVVQLRVAAPRGGNPIKKICSKFTHTFFGI